MCATNSEIDLLVDSFICAAQPNELLKDIPWTVGKVEIRVFTSLPKVTWRKP